MKRIKKYRFNLKVEGVGESPDKAWERALAAYYLDKMCKENPPPMPSYEVVADFGFFDEGTTIHVNSE